ncbi:MarR family transcriptional regulator [Nocardia panacis]|uniref:MarR family transcriptional regulator n=1 Tax=Nocardia panacis TaxID=2340916 RepID=A0A3A4L5K3_9NOCA|nr:MarR family transcriptional regulator [Nocardia panacis]RJO77901.1 MarR family transcriptional regulator [Nocardia panacis]
MDETIETIATQLARLQRMRDRTAAQLAVVTKNRFEVGAFRLLFQLNCAGPMRSGALAAAVDSDASTVSRQVAQLVEREFVVRQADPEDGRATVLVVTDKGRDMVAEMRRHRAASLGRVLADWDPEKRTEFAGLLRRFVDDYEHLKPAMLAAMRSEWGTKPSDMESDS